MSKDIKPFSEEEMREFLRVEVLKHRGQDHLAKRLGISPSSVHNALHGKGGFPQKLLQHMGFTKRVEVHFVFQE